MEHWEFLIQEDGDRLWLPLSSPQTTLTAGRYRVMARTTPKVAPKRSAAEVCVRYEPSSADVGEPLFSRSACPIDESGAIAVLPLTDLAPGVWELSCSTAIGNPDAPPRAKVSLHVGERAGDRPATPATPAAPPTQASVPPPEPSPVAATPELGLQLSQDAYSLKAGEPLRLTGRVMPPPSANDTAANAPIAGLHLRIRLREPQSLRVIVALQRLLPRQTPPLDFEYAIAIPDSCNSRLILGEVVLCDTVPTVLAKQSFTVTARLEVLLDAIADGKLDASLLERSQAVYTPTPFQPQPPPLELDPAQTQKLPPRLARPAADSENAQSHAKGGIELPSFGNPPPDREAYGNHNRPSLSLPADSPFDDDPDLTTPEPPAALPPSPLGSNRSSDRPSLPFDRQDRFVSRLNEMARDEDLSEWLAIEAQRPDNPFALTEADNDLSPWEATEIVVDDEPLVPPPLPEALDPPASDRPIPTPELIVPLQNLWVGRPVLIRARLPQVGGRVYVKLWIHDRQNQILLDGPRWLTDFFATEDGMMESMVQLAIPRGGLELQFEAIAVDMDTERESYKVGVTRRVSPPGLPSLPLTAKDD